MISSAALPAGIVIVVIVVVDVVLTTLHPGRAGPLSAATRRSTWRMLSRVARLPRLRFLLGLAGPVSVAANILAWIGGLWVGFALVYLPSVEALAYAPAVPFGDHDIVDALYLSSVSLTTVGFGDVVAHDDGLRLVTTLEGASGLGVITAAISYVLSLYPMLNRTRAAAETAAQLGLRSAIGATAAVTSAQGLQHALALHREVVAAHHAVRRFSALFYFVAADERESVVALTHAAATVSVVLRWGVDSRRIHHADEVGRALEAALRTLIDDYEKAFGPLLEDGRDQTTPPSQALEQLRADVASVDASLAASPGEPGDGFAEYVARTQQFLDQLAGAYGYRPPQLLESPDGTRRS